MVNLVARRRLVKRGNLSGRGEQPRCVFQIGCVEAFGEPAVDRRKKITGLNTETLIAP
jgi:hypothetical protein